MNNAEALELTPTWAAVLPILLAGVERGDQKAREAAKIELRRMADAADKWNARNQPETPA
jgi:hypothetical protein